MMTSLQLFLRKSSATTALHIKPKRILGISSHWGQHSFPPVPTNKTKV